MAFCQKVGLASSDLAFVFVHQRPDRELGEHDGDQRLAGSATVSRDAPQEATVEVSRMPRGDSVGASLTGSSPVDDRCPPAGRSGRPRATASCSRNFQAANKGDGTTTFGFAGDRELASTLTRSCPGKGVKLDGNLPQLRKSWPLGEEPSGHIGYGHLLARRRDSEVTGLQTVRRP